jgi:hypothetical protein
MAVMVRSMMIGPVDETSNPRLLVLTSTFPRWRDDPEPAFVHELARRLTDGFDIHCTGARRCSWRRSW